MTLVDTIHLPEEIKSFPQGEQESSALVAVPELTWNQLLEEIKNLKAKVASLEQGYATFREQSHKEILFLKEKIASQNMKIVTLESAVADQDRKIVVLETVHDKDIERLALEAAYDRQRVTKLEQKEPQPLQKDRGEILRALIATNGGKMLAKYARLKMRLDKATFSRLLSTLSDHVTRKVYQPDRRHKLLVLNIS